MANRSNYYPRTLWHLAKLLNLLRRDNAQSWEVQNLGVHQVVADVIYEIKDNKVLERLLDTKHISSDEIREFVRNKKLIAIKGEEVTSVIINYKESHIIKIFLIVFFTILIGIIILILYLKWKNMKLEMKRIDEELKSKNKKIEALIRNYNDKEEKN